METYLRPPKGVGAGKPMKLGQFQKDWIEEVLAADVDAAVMQFPRGNGKSTFSAGLAVWGVFDDIATGAPQVPIVATTVTQAMRSVYTVAAQMIGAEPELANRSISYTAIGNTRVFVPSTLGEMFPMSNDTDGIQGLDPSLAICDEVGFQPIESWDGLLLAGGKRSQSLVMGLGTPGLDRENALFHVRELVRGGADLPGFRFKEYSADPGCEVNDREQWRKANPAMVEGFLNERALVTSLGLSPEAHFRIFRLGQWVDGTDSWLGSDGYNVWDGLRDPLPLVVGDPTWVGVDIGLKRDSSAVVAVQFREDGRLHASCRLWVPTKAEPVDVTDIMQHLRDLRDRYKVGAISFDPRLFDVPAKFLYDEGLPMVEIPQSPERMTPIIGDLYELIREGKISHDGDTAFTQQVLNAIPRFTDRGFTLQKAKSRGRIDGVIALSLAVDRARHKERPKPPVVVL
jgi:phage terminase large subunit-like protein